jgi:hypothetical protein
MMQSTTKLSANNIVQIRNNITQKAWMRKINNGQLKQLIALIMEAASTSAMSGNFYQTTRQNNPTRHNIPEDSHLQKQQMSEDSTYHI